MKEKYIGKDCSSKVKIEETKKQLNLSRKLPNINQIVQDCSFDEIINAVKQHIEYIYEKKISFSNCFFGFDDYACRNVLRLWRSK